MKRYSLKLAAGFLGLLMAAMSFAAQITGTIPINNVPRSEWPGLAKITIEKAIENALSHIPGRSLGAELDNEDGFLVYSVEIATAEGQVIEATIDAGDGQLLDKEIED